MRALPPDPGRARSSARCSRASGPRRRPRRARAVHLGTRGDPCATADRRPDRPGGRGLVIAEGVVVVRRMISSPYPVRSLLGVPRRFDELADDLAALPVPAYAADPETMAAVVGFHLNRGVLAVADRAA